MSNQNLYIDARSLTRATQDGKHIYSRELIAHLKLSAPAKLNLILLSDQKQPGIDRVIAWPWHINVARLVNADPQGKYFSPMSFVTAALISRPCFVTVHDLIAFLQAKLVPSLKAIILENIFLRILARKANVHYICVSQSTKSDLDQLFPKLSKRSLLSSIGSLIQVKAVSKQPYILCLQAISPRKNQLLLLQMLELIPAQQRIKLILAGSLDKRYLTHLKEFIEKHKLQNWVEIRGTVSLAEKIKLFQHAQLCIYPNLYEGFGMPLIEAMLCHSLVVSSDIAVFQEINQVPQARFPSQDAKALAKLVSSLLAGPKLIQSLQHQQYQQTQKYNWHNIAYNLWKIFQ